MILLIKDLAARQKAAQLFGHAIRRRWQVPSQEATAWVEAEFLDPRSFVFAAIRDRRLQAVICGCPLAYVHAPMEERIAVARALGLKGDDASCLSRILHMGGLAVGKHHEHRQLVRPLHEAAREEAARRGYTHIVGQTVLPARNRGVFNHHWIRVQHMGWQVLKGVHSDRLVKGVPISWLVLP
ncbi:MAG: hypothetical protein AAB898_01235 [Patescibacteria group bacterium]